MRPLVLLHGFTGSGASFDRLRASLPAREVHTPTLPGHDAMAPAASPAPAASHANGAAWDASVAEVVEALHAVPAPFDLLGYSLGGRVALGLLARIPERIASLVLVGAHPGLTTESERTMRRAHDARFVRMLREEGIDAFVRAWEAEPLFASQRALSADVVAIRNAERRRRSAEGLARSLERMGLAEMPDLRSALVAFRGPVAYVVGELDTKFRAVADDVLREVPHSKLTIVEGAGHDVVLEAPEAIARIAYATARSVDRTNVPEISEENVAR